MRHVKTCSKPRLAATSPQTRCEFPAAIWSSALSPCGRSQYTGAPSPTLKLTSIWWSSLPSTSQSSSIRFSVAHYPWATGASLAHPHRRSRFAPQRTVATRSATSHRLFPLASLNCSAYHSTKTLLTATRSIVSGGVHLWS